MIYQCGRRARCPEKQRICTLVHVRIRILLGSGSIYRAMKYISEASKKVRKRKRVEWSRMKHAEYVYARKGEGAHLSCLSNLESPIIASTWDDFCLPSQAECTEAPKTTVSADERYEPYWTPTNTEHHQTLGTISLQHPQTKSCSQPLSYPTDFNANSISDSSGWH